jgi:hypothetical protein
MKLILVALILLACAVLSIASGSAFLVFIFVVFALVFIRYAAVVLKRIDPKPLPVLWCCICGNGCRNTRHHNAHYFTSEELKSNPK